MSGDLISREALKKSVNDEFERLNYILYKNNDYYLAVKRTIATVLDFIDNAPAIDVICPDCYIRYSQGYIDGATNNPKECKACDYYKLAQSFINGIVEIMSKNGLTSVDELLETLKKGVNNNE